MKAATALLILLPFFASGQTVIDFGLPKIAGSATGLSDGHANLSGDPLGAGVSFDLTVTASTTAGGSLTVTGGPDGLGVSGGVEFFVDNRNDLDPTNDETITFALDNVVGLSAGQSLRITGIRILFGINTSPEQFA